MKKPEKKILIVDDQPIVRQGLRKLLNQEPGLVVAGETNGAARAIEFMGHQKVDGLILGLNTPNFQAFEALKEIRTAAPELPIFVLGIQDEVHYALRVLRSGASGFLSKKMPLEVLLEGIKEVLKGKRFAPPAIERELSRFPDQDVLPRHETLSKREFQIFQLLALGHSHKMIAEMCFIKTKTVSIYRTRILIKLRLKKTSELLPYAMENGLLKKFKDGSVSHQKESSGKK